MTSRSLGYSYLVHHYKLPARSLLIRAHIDPKTRGRQLQQIGHQQVLVFEPKYQPANTLVDQLQFAIRYEGINLEILALLFQETGEKELNTWLADNPTSTYARRAGYLYEWLSGKSLKPNVPSKERYVALLDTQIQFGLKKGERDGGILTNL